MEFAPNPVLSVVPLYPNPGVDWEGNLSLIDSIIQLVPEEELSDFYSDICLR